MNLKLDENLGHAITELFRMAGHDVQTVPSEGLSGAPDEQVLAACRSEGRGLVTLDMDFSNPLIFKPSEHAGIAVLRLPPKPSADDLIRASRTLLDAIGKYSFGGKLWSVDRGRIREYRPADDPSGRDET